ncbi:MAG: acetyl-CoA carboxylase, biotin carboxyl carrier protein, partial [Sphingomonadales bacterium]
MADDNKQGAMHVDIELVRQLAAVLDETQLTEIEVEDGERRVRVARTVTAAPAVQYAAAPAPARRHIALPARP